MVVDMPFWARIDSGQHQTDSMLSVHIHTHSTRRQRHDSVLSKASLGEDDNEALVTLDDADDARTLDDILETLPGKSQRSILRDNNKCSILYVLLFLSILSQMMSYSALPGMIHGDSFHLSLSLSLSLSQIEYRLKN